MTRLVSVLVALLVPVSAAAAAPAVAPERIDRAAAFLTSNQNSDGGFGEPGAASDPTLSAWVALGLDAAGLDAARVRAGETTLGAYLERQSPEEATDIELQLLARAALGLDTRGLVATLRGEVRPSGRIGPRLNSTIWGVIALRAAGVSVPKSAVRYVRRHQDSSGGFSFVANGPPDTNDTAAAVQALRSAGMRATSRPIKRALRYLARARARSGGYPLVPGKAPDTQSTGWTLQAYAAAGRAAPRKALRFLVRRQQADGSLHYRSQLGITPVWVTAQALPALVGSSYVPPR